MPLERCLEVALRVAVLLGIALLAMPLLRRSAAATRRIVLALALCGALVVPAMSVTMPAWQVRAPAAVDALRAVVVTEPLAPEGTTPATVPADARAMPSAPRVASWGPKAWLAAIWALGALFVIVRLVVAFIRARGMVRRAIASTPWSAVMARAARVMNARAAVRVSDDVDAPAVTGLLAPVVLVPRASESWSDARRYAVLLHELAHVRQWDCLAHAVAQIACAVHWFNPLVWLAVRRFRRERELAADDAVLVAGARASAYAEDLLAIAGARENPRAVPAAALGMVERSELVHRVEAIVAPGRSRRPPTPLRRALLVFAFAALTVAIACATPSTPAAAKTAALVPPSAARSESAIDPRWQAIADEELDRALAESNGVAGTVVFLEPSTGEILANAGRDHGARADVASRGYVPGSTFKIVTLAAALDEGAVSASERIDCGRGSVMVEGRPLWDNGAHGRLSLAEILAVSSNIGVSKVFDRLGGERLSRWGRAFHFDMARIEDRSYAGAVAAIGQGLTATPLQVAAAFAVLANDGAYVAPTAERRIGEPPREPILKRETARSVLAMLDEAVNGERATGTLARVSGQRIAGKTGTSAWDLPDGTQGRYVSFVGFASPRSRARAARVVILVGVEQPREGSTGGNVAAPAFARVAARL